MALRVALGGATKSKPAAKPAPKPAAKKPAPKAAPKKAAPAKSSTTPKRSTTPKSPTGSRSSTSSRTPPKSTATKAPAKQNTKATGSPQNPARTNNTPANKPAGGGTSTANEPRQAQLPTDRYEGPRSQSATDPKTSETNGDRTNQTEQTAQNAQTANNERQSEQRRTAETEQQRETDKQAAETEQQTVEQSREVDEKRSQERDEQRRIAEMQQRYQEDTRQLAQKDEEKLQGILQQSYGDKLSEEQGGELSEQAKTDGLPQPDPSNVRFVDSEELNGNDGAYVDQDGGTVLLNRQLKEDQDALDRVYREEAGHHLDRELGGADSAGDEGEIFAKGLEEGAPLDAERAERLKQQDDQGQLQLDGETVDAEFKSPGGRGDVQGGGPGQLQEGDFGGQEEGGFPPGVQPGGFGPGGQDPLPGLPGQGAPVPDDYNKPVSVTRDGTPPGPGDFLVERGGFEQGIGAGQATPTAQQMTDAVRFMDQRMKQLDEQLQDAQLSGDPAKMQETFRNAREFEQGSQALLDTFEHMTNMRPMGMDTFNSVDSIQRDAEGRVLDNTAAFVESMAPGGDGPSATGWGGGEGKPPEQMDLDYLAQLSVGGDLVPPGTEMGPKSMSHKMWDRLQTEANKPGNEELRARLDTAAQKAGQTAEQSRELYEKALYAEDGDERRQALSELEQTGSLFYGRHMDSLRAADPMLSVPDMAGFDEADLYHQELKELAGNGNVFAEQALDELGDNFSRNFASSDPKVSSDAQRRFEASQDYLRNVNDTDRVDFALQNLTSHSSVDDLRNARERLDTEIKRDNEVAADVRDRVAVQEELTGLEGLRESADKTERVEDLQKRAEEGDAVARRTLTEILDAKGRPVEGSNEPFELSRLTGDDVRVPEFGRADHSNYAVAAAESLANDTSYAEAYVLGQAVDRSGAGREVQSAADKALLKGIEEGNVNTLGGMTRALIDPSDGRYSRLANTFHQAREMPGFENALDAVGRSAAHGNERALTAVSRELALDEDATDRDRQLADISQKHLIDAARGGYGREVTKELLYAPDGGHGDQYYRTLGTAAGSAEKLNREQRDQVMSRLNKGLMRGSDETQRTPESAHAGAAEGMAEMVEHVGVEEAATLSATMSPHVVDAFEKMGPKLTDAQGKTLMAPLRGMISDRSLSQDDKDLAVRSIGKLGRFADTHDVESIVRNFGQNEDNRAGFDGMVNILSRTDNAQVRTAAVDALMDDERASWNNLSNVDRDTKQRLVDYVTGSGDWNLEADIGKLLGDVKIRPPLPALMERYGVQGSRDEIINKTLEARGHYGDAAVRNLGANTSQWNRLSPDMRQELLGWQDRELSDADRTLLQSNIDTSWAADLMSQGDLHTSPAKFLLDDLGERTQSMLGEQRRKGDALEKELRQDREFRDDHLERITGDAKKGLSFGTEAGHVLSYLTGERLISGEKTEREHRIDGQNQDIQRLEQLDGRLQEKAQQISQARRQEMFLDTARAGYEREQLLAEGQYMDADKVSFEQWDKHGELLEQLDPQMYEDLHRPDSEAGARGDGGWSRLNANDEFHLKEAPKYSEDSNTRYQEALDVIGGEVKGQERSAVVKDALRVLDQDKSSQNVTDAAGVLSRELPTIQSMLSAGANGGAFDDYVDNVRGRTTDVLDQLDNLQRPEVRSQVEGRIEQLKKLEENMEGHPASELKDVTARRESLEKMMALSAEDSDLRNMLGTVMDESKFRADTWENWAKYEGPKVAGAIGVGVLAAGATVATFGAAAPLAAVAFAGAAGGLVGSELGAEAVHAYQNNFDADVSSGRTTFSARSKIGHKVNGDQIRDAETGEMRDRTWGGDVALPYAKELSTNFAISYATLGFGKIFSGGINKLLGSGGFADDLANIGGKLAPVESALGQEGTKRTINEVIKQTARQFPKEFTEEVGEEVAEGAIQKGLNAVDKRLGMLSGLVLSTGRGINLNVNTRGGYDYDGQAATDAITGLRNSGYDVEIDPDRPGHFTVNDGSNPAEFSPQGETPNAEEWARLQNAPEQAPLPAELENDPGVQRDRAFAQRQLARRYEQGLLDGQIPEGMTEGDVKARVEQLRTDAERLQNRADGGGNDPTNVRDATGVADADTVDRVQGDAEVNPDGGDDDQPRQTPEQLAETVRQRQVAVDNEQRRLAKIEESYMRELEKQEALMGERFNGPKPAYEHATHHDPDHPDFRGRGDTTTHIPADAEEVYRNTIPDPDSDGRTWWGRADNGDYYRFQATPAGTHLHWNGATGESGGARANKMDDVPAHIKQRYKNADNIKREEGRIEQAEADLKTAQDRLQQAQDAQNPPGADETAGAPGKRKLPLQGRHGNDYPMNADGTQYAAPTRPSQSTPQRFLNEEMLPALREIKNKDGSLRYPESVAELERLSERMARAEQRGHTTEWNLNNASYNRRSYGPDGQQNGSTSSISVRNVHDWNANPRYHPSTTDYLHETAGRFANTMTHELSHGNASNAIDRAFDPTLSREENIDRMHQVALEDEASRVRNGYRAEQVFAREARRDFYYNAKTNDPAIEQARRDFERGGNATEIQQGLIDHIADTYRPSTNPDMTYREKYRANAEAAYERNLRNYRNNPPTEAETTRINQMQTDLDAVRDTVQNNPADAQQALDQLQRQEAWQGIDVENTANPVIGRQTMQDVWQDMQQYQLSEQQMGELGYLFGRDEADYRVSRGSTTYSGADGTVRAPAKWNVDRPEGMPESVYNEFVRGVNERHAESTLNAYHEAARNSVRPKVEMNVAMDPVQRDVQPQHAAVLAAHQQAPLTNGERQRIETMSQDLQRAQDLAQTDPKAALDALQNLQGQDAWQGLNTDVGSRSVYPERFVDQFYQDIQEYQRMHPEADIEETAYQYGREEMGDRLENYYRGTNGQVSIPGDVRIFRPEGMPESVFNALSRGMNAEHAERVVGAYRDAAQGLPRVRTQLDVPLDGTQSQGPLPAHLQPVLRGMPRPEAPPVPVEGTNPRGQAFGQDDTGSIRVHRGEGGEAGPTEGDYQPARINAIDADGMARYVDPQRGIDHQVPLGELLTLRPDLVPPGLELKVQRSNGEVQDGWRVVGYEAGSRIRMNRNGLEKKIPAADLAQLNQGDLMQRLDAHAANRVPAGDERPAYMAAAQNGMARYVDPANNIDAQIPVAELLRNNPAAIPNGTRLRVRRSSGAIEDGWRVIGTHEGKVLVEKGESRKPLLAEDVAELNPDLNQRLPQGPQVQNTPAPAPVDANVRVIDDTVHHPGNAPELHRAMIEQYGLQPRYSVEVGDTKYSITDPVDIGGGRMAALAVVETPQGSSLRAFYRSNSQGEFRVLPAMNRGLGHIGVPGYDKGNGEYTLSLPPEVNARLAGLSGQPRQDIPANVGKELFAGAVPVNRTVDDYMRYANGPDYPNIEATRIVEANPDAKRYPRQRGEPMLEPSQVRLPQNLQPDFSRPVMSYKAATATAGEVDAQVFQSRDGSLNFTVFRDAQNHAWIANVGATKGGMNPHGLPLQGTNPGELTTPRWEYTSMTPANFQGIPHPSMDQYNDLWPYVRDMPIIQDYYRARGEEVP